MKLPLTFSRRFLMTATLATMLLTASASAAIGIYWSKEQVTPVVFVKPAPNGFVPVDGGSTGNTWTKDQVTPMCLVTSAIGGFVPAHGTIIGNTWSKDEVKPFIEVAPSMYGFTPK